MSMFLHSGECSMNPAAISRMAAPPTEAEVTSSTTTINELPVDVLAEVLLCVPTPVDLIRAAAVSKQWRRVITSDAIATPNRTRSHGAITTPEPSSEPKSFLAVYRERKKSSIFLGLYIPRQISGPPGFHKADSIRPSAVDRGLKVAARKAWEYEHIERHQDHRLHDAVDNAFIRGPLGVHPDCRLLDCHNSLLLLTSGDEALEVRSPLPRESILVPFPPDADPESLEACLLQGHGRSAAAFRVVYLQHRREGRNRLARAAEYDSTRKSWQHHSWQTIKGRIEGSPQAVMHAGHRMFWRYSGRSQAALMLDTRKMEFSVLPLPTDSNFATGEIEDNVCCLVEAIDSNWFKVWRLEEEKLEWKLEKDISLDQVFAKHVRHRVGYHRPCAISNGMALMCSTTRSHHFVLDLNTCSLIDVFEFQGRSAYIMQMPWPPAFPHPTGDSDKHGEPASVDDSSTGAGELDEIEGLLGGIPALAEEPMHVDTCQAWPEPSPTPSLGCCFSTDPLALHPLEPLRVYLRTHALDQMVQAVGASAGLRVIKRVDQTLQELGVNLKPKVPTKAVCLEHIELQNELLTLLNLQKQLQTKEAEVSANWESSFTEAPSTPKVLSTGQVPLLNLQCPSLMETWLKLQRQLRGCIKIV